MEESPEEEGDLRIDVLEHRVEEPVEEGILVVWITAIFLPV